MDDEEENLKAWLVLLMVAFILGACMGIRL
jgi:hypothetical protein